MEKTPSEEAKDKLLRRYRSLAKRWHQMTADELLETYLSSLTSSFDPHTSYMSPGTLENFEIGMRLQLDGIGAQLKGEDGYTTIVELTPGGAADKDGRLKSKDRVVGVGQGTEGEIVDVVDMNLNEVVKLIRGKRGTTVRLKVIPVGENVPKVYDITRAKIELKDAEARGEVIEHGKKTDGTPYKVGRDQPAELLSSTWPAPSRARRSSRAAPATASGSSKTSASRVSTAWCLTCGATAAVRCRRRSS